VNKRVVAGIDCSVLIQQFHDSQADCWSHEARPFPFRISKMLGEINGGEGVISSASGNETGQKCIAWAAV